MTVRSSDGPSAVPGLVCAALVGTVPPLVWFLFGGSPTIMAWGAALWVLAVVVKIPVAGVVHLLLSRRIPVAAMSALHGITSAACELGVAGYWFLRHRPIAVEEIMSFGIGAGSLETLVIVAFSMWGAVVGKSPGEEAAAQWHEHAPRSLWVRYYLPIERFGALLGHVAARGLIALAVGGASLLQSLLLALLPLVTFSAVDGVASFGETKGWKWLDPRIARPFYTAVLLVGAAELVLFVVLALRLH